MVGALAAYLSGAKRIAVPEGGQGALGPIFIGRHDGDYRSHPVFLCKMQRFVRALLRYEIAYEFPRLWSTKGQTLRAAIAAAVNMPWRETRSCWQPSTQRSLPGERRQCGFCAACLLRRLSVHAAGESEDVGSYMLEDLSAPTLAAGMAAGYNLTKLGEAQQLCGHRRSPYGPSGGSIGGAGEAALLRAADPRVGQGIGGVCGGC
jgi:hypothetical protein